MTATIEDYEDVRSLLHELDVARSAVVRAAGERGAAGEQVAA